MSSSAVAQKVSEELMNDFRARVAVTRPRGNRVSSGSRKGDNSVMRVSSDSTVMELYEQLSRRLEHQGSTSTWSLISQTSSGQLFFFFKSVK